MSGTVGGLWGFSDGRQLGSRSPGVRCVTRTGSASAASSIPSRFRTRNEQSRHQAPESRRSHHGRSTHRSLSVQPTRRANRTHTEEFYEVTDAEPDLASLQAELRVWETVYDTIRPHQALGYRTPAEYLASLGSKV
jgi:hypothetical protein